VREGTGWRVEGIEATRAVAFADLTNPDAARIASNRLSRLGVDEALAAAGAQPGDEVRIGDMIMEYSAPNEAEK
jgi:GTP-binding protein